MYECIHQQKNDQVDLKVKDFANEKETVKSLEKELEAQKSREKKPIAEFASLYDNCKKRDEVTSLQDLEAVNAFVNVLKEDLVDEKEKVRFLELELKFEKNYQEDLKVKIADLNNTVDI